MFIAKAAPSVINCGTNTNRMLCHFKVLCGWLGSGFFPTRALISVVLSWIFFCYYLKVEIRGHATRKEVPQTKFEV